MDVENGSIFFTNPLSFLLYVVGMAAAYTLYNWVLSAGSPSGYGPRTYPILGSFPSYWTNRHRLHAWYTELLRTSPSQTIIIKRFGSIPTVVTANPQNVEHILRNRFDNYPKGRQFTAILYDLLGNGIFNTDGEEWKVQRRITAHEFSSAWIKNFVVPVVQSEIKDRFFPLLDNAAQRGRVLDLQEIFRSFAFENICRIALGLSPGDCPDADRGFQRAFDVAAELCARRATEPLAAVWKIKRKLQIGSEKRLAEAVRSVHGFATDVVRRRRAGGDSWRQDLLSKFLGSNLDDFVFLRDVVINFILAGRDTTSAALTWFFWLLSSNPRVEAKILREIVTIKDPYSALSYKELQSLNYMHAAISESMRLYPPVPFDSKHALRDDVLPDGTVIKRGTRVTYHPFAMGRMESIWGPDCLVFRPERWLNEEGAFVAEDPFRFAIFQGGTRVCLGKDLAFVQMKSVIASIVAGFELRPSEPVDSPVVSPSLSLRMRGGLPVTVRKRRAASIVSKACLDS